MPRGKRKSCDEKLEELRCSIEELEQQLKELKARERELLKAKREEELKQIAEFLEVRGLSAGELAEILERSEAAG